MTEVEFNKPDDLDQLLDTEELKILLKVPREKIGWFRQYGLLPQRKIGRSYVITKTEYRKFLDLTVGANLGTKADIITFSKLHKLKKNS
jgi:hypothetical protein